VGATGQLALLGQVNPQLQGVCPLVAEGELAVDDAVSSGHPLHVPGGQRSGVAEVVSVLQDPVDDQRHGLQAAVRVPVEAR